MSTESAAPVSSAGHRWPCPRFYALENAHPCKCGKDAEGVTPTAPTGQWWPDAASIITDAERAEITRCLDEHGGVCREVMCDDSLDVLVDRIARRHAAMAWDQGWAALREFAGDDLPERPRNPYRTRPTSPAGSAS